MNGIGGCTDHQFVRTFAGYPLMGIRIEVLEHLLRQVELHNLLFTGLQADLAERLEFLDRTNNTGLLRRNVQLHNLLAGTCARVANADAQRIAAERGFAHGKCCVTQSVTEGKQRFYPRRNDRIGLAGRSIYKRFLTAIKVGIAVADEQILLVLHLVVHTGIGNSAVLVRGIILQRRHDSERQVT